MRKNKRKWMAFVLAALLVLSCGVSPVYAQEAQAGQQTGTEPLELDETAVPMEDIPTEEPVNTEPDSGIPETEPSTEPETSVQENEPEEVTDKEAGKEMADEPAIEEQKEAGGQEAEPTQELREDHGVQPYAENNAGDFHVTGGMSGTDWVYDSGNNTLTFKTSGTYTVTGDGQETLEQIHVDANFTGTITIQNVNAEKMIVHNTAQLTLMLEGANTLRKGLDFSDAVTGTLIIDSKTNGSLTATGEADSAGIGGGNEGNSGNNITINGGTVTATSLRGAGIGSGLGREGEYCSGKDITINGGTVIATGVAGIGGGARSSGKDITINGGTVTATGNDGAGIGGGAGSEIGDKSASDITINGGIVTATSGYAGAGIGGGEGDPGKNITISGGTVTATSVLGAGIGGGDSDMGKNIIISGGTVTVTSEYGAGIGGGRLSSASGIIISGGTVTATGNNGGAGIGGGRLGSASDIKITGGSVKANSIGATPTDGQGNNVYLAKLDKHSDINEVTVDDRTYTRNGNHPDNDGAFYLYLAGKEHKIKTSIGAYTAIWNDSNGFTIKPVSPVITIASKTASSITVKALDNQEIYGTAEYSLNGTNWQDSNIFNNLHSAGYGGNYTIYARYKGNDSYLQSEVGKMENVSTNSADYTITIPAKPVEAGNTESKAEIKPSDSFDVGYGGKAEVKIKGNSGVSKDGKLTLTRQNDMENRTVTSALFLNNAEFTDITKPLTTFRSKADTGVILSFEQPKEKNILAGTYSGTITFEVSYSE